MSDLKKVPTPTVGEFSRQRKCSKCEVELVNPTGVHMGIPFGKVGAVPGTWVLLCGRCYDEVTVDEHKIERST